MDEQRDETRIEHEPAYEPPHAEDLATDESPAASATGATGPVPN